MGEIAKLDEQRARRFLQHLADHPFVTVVVADDGQVIVFSKGMDEGEYERIRAVLTDIQKEGE